MRNKVLLIAFALILSLPVSVQAVDDIVQKPLSYEEQMLVEPEVSNTNVIQQNQENFSMTKPISKRQIVKKFFAAMLGVAFSSLIIFFGLSFYNKIRESLKNQVKTPDGTTPLTTPDDIDSAVKTFLDKTKWG